MQWIRAVLDHELPSWIGMGRGRQRLQLSNRSHVNNVGFPDNDHHNN